MLIAIATFLIALVALLAVPVRLSYWVSWRRSIQGNVQLHWLFGLVQLQLPLARAKPPTMKQKTSGGKKRARAPSNKKTNPFGAIRQKAFRQRVFRFVRDIWRSIRKQNLTLHVRIGLGDPADTGRLWAVFGPIAGMLTMVQDASIEISPEFTDAVFELDSSGNIRVVPVQMIYLTFGLLLSPSFWQGLKQIR
jgi:hypothetical protein